MEIGIFPTIAGNDFFFNFLGLSGTPKSPEASIGYLGLQYLCRLAASLQKKAPHIQLLLGSPT